VQYLDRLLGIFYRVQTGQGSIYFIVARYSGNQLQNFFWANDVKSAGWPRCLCGLPVVYGLLLINLAFCRQPTAEDRKTESFASLRIHSAYQILTRRFIVSISSISSVANAYQPTLTNWQNKLSQIRQGFKELARTLQSGDLTGAQMAFASLQPLLPNSSAGNQTQNGQQGSGQSPFATDFSALGQALQSGDVTKAQQAYAKLQQDMQAVQGHHHHHHHNASASIQSTAPTTSSLSAGSIVGRGQNQFATDFSALGQALQSGDLSQAQAAFAKLQQDMGPVAGNFNVSV
jgi:hypothetical protein